MPEAPDPLTTPLIFSTRFTFPIRTATALLPAVRFTICKPNCFARFLPPQIRRQSHGSRFRTVNREPFNNSRIPDNEIVPVTLPSRSQLTHSNARNDFTKCPPRTTGNNESRSVTIRSGPIRSSFERITRRDATTDRRGGHETAEHQLESGTPRIAFRERLTSGHACIYPPSRSSATRSECSRFYGHAGPLSRSYPYERLRSRGTRPLHGRIYVSLSAASLFEPIGKRVDHRRANLSNSIDVLPRLYRIICRYVAINRRDAAVVRMDRRQYVH